MVNWNSIKHAVADSWLVCFVADVFMFFMEAVGLPLIAMLGVAAVWLCMVAFIWLSVFCLEFISKH